MASDDGDEHKEETVEEHVVAETTDAHETHGDASSHDAHPESEEFNAGEMIMHHVTDAHDIHLMDIGGHPVSIPLPVIIYSVDDGLSVFMSSKFEHGHAEYDGYILQHGHVYKRDVNQSDDAASQGFLAENLGGVFSGEQGAFIDLSITKTTFGIFLTVFHRLVVGVVDGRKVWSC